MSVQFEDCVDCVKVIYPHFDFVFLFDHSQGHAKKLVGGLDAYCMNKGYGGAQPMMRESRKLSTYLKRRQQSNVCFHFQGHWSILDVTRRKGTESS